MKHTYSITGMTCSSCAGKVKHQLEQHKDVTSVTINLELNEASISMNKHVQLENLQQLFEADSKYSILEKKPTIKYQEATLLAGEEKSKLETFKPLIIIFLFIALVSGIASVDSMRMDVMKWMNYFMAGFFITFSFFKFLDLKSFVDSYSMYDLLAKKVKNYGFVYPFIELVLGIAYLTQYEPKITYTVTILVMGFSSLGVIRSVLDKKKIKCACLGSVFNLPMTTVTIIEDLLMVAMAAFMLWSV
ncbi:MAG: heavy-metal-associated domain-containing protein [Flavobacteriales bacterium]|nr:heavy-metal-associated domain-containing protein [Flavobacteriales bacterium]